jgi:hypothetical protein
MKEFCFGLLLAVASWPALAVPPQHVTLQYEMSRNGSVMADVVETLDHDGHSYTLDSEVRGRGVYLLLGVLKRTSRGRIEPTGLQPLEFTDQRGFRAPVLAHFDWNRHVVRQENDGKNDSVDMPAGSQGTLLDPLSMAYTFSFVPPAGRDIQALRADGRGLTPFRFAVMGTEKLQTPAGEIQALHISKVRDGPEDKATEIWLASDRNLLPVRVLVVEKDGTRIDQVVSRIGN